MRAEQKHRTIMMIFLPRILFAFRLAFGLQNLTSHVSIPMSAAVAPENRGGLKFVLIRYHYLLVIVG